MSLLLLNHSHLRWPLGLPPLALLQGCPSAVPQPLELSLGRCWGSPASPSCALMNTVPVVFSLAGLHRVFYPLALCPWARVQVGWVTWGQAGLS